MLFYLHFFVGGGGFCDSVASWHLFSKKKKSKKVSKTLQIYLLLLQEREPHICTLPFLQDLATLSCNLPPPPLSSSSSIS